MLKNIAIPLMLTGSSAQDGTKLSEDQIKRMMRQDREVEEPELKASKIDACTTGDGNYKYIPADAPEGTVGESIQQLEQNLSDAQKLAATKQTEINDFMVRPVAADPDNGVEEVAGGAWGVAAAARETAVKDAAAKEVADNIAALIETADDDAALEREKAEAYRLAQDAVEIAKYDFGVADAAWTVADAKKTTMNTAKVDAGAAVQTAKNQITAETLAREYLYCELGQNLTGGDGTNWWTFLTAAGTASDNLQAAPYYCAVPAIMNSSNVQVRPAIRYFTSHETDSSQGAADGKTFLTLGPEDLTHNGVAKCEDLSAPDAGTGLCGDSSTPSWKRWTRKLTYDQRVAATEAIDAAGDDIPSAGGVKRNWVTKVAYYTGEVAALTYRVARLTAEEAFYADMKSMGTAAREEAENQAVGTDANEDGNRKEDKDAYVVPADSKLGLTAGAAGAWNALVTADYTRAGFKNAEGATNKDCRLYDHNSGGGNAGQWVDSNGGFADCCYVTNDTNKGYCALLPNKYTFPHNKRDVNDGAITNTATSRDLSDVAGWRMDLTAPDGTSINAWKALTSYTNDESALKKWWQKASTFHAKAKLWNDAAFAGAASNGSGGFGGSDLEKLTTGTGLGQTEVTDNGSNTGSTKACDVTTDAAKWQAVLASEITALGGGAAEDAAGCRKYVEKLNKEGILADPKQKWNNAAGTAQTERDNGGAYTWAKYLVEPTWHKYWSYHNEGNTNEKCHYSTDNTVTATANQGSDGNSKCQSNTGTAPTAESFYLLAKAIYDNDPTNGSGSNAYSTTNGGADNELTKLTAEMDALATLENNVLAAWYETQYFAAIQAELADDASGSRQASVVTKHTYIGTTGNDANVNGQKSAAENALSTSQGALDTAKEKLAELEVAVSTASAAIAGVESRIRRHNTELAELATLVTDAQDGTLDKQFAELTALYDAFIGAQGEFGKLDALKTSLSESLVVGYQDDGVTAIPDTVEGSLRETERLAKTAWESAVQTAAGSLQNLNDAIEGTTITALREAVTTATSDFNEQNNELTNKRNALNGLNADVATAQATLDLAVADCQVQAYDAYRKTLANDLKKRADDLATIEKLLQDMTIPARGTAGARCEKALSLGTSRPRFAQGREAVCDEGLCCGAAKIWMTSGVTENAGWKIVETCQTVDTTSYNYTPPRAPMQTTAPETIAATFTCIEGAHKLAAAASALAAAFYMLA